MRRFRRCGRSTSRLPSTGALPRRRSSASRCSTMTTPATLNRCLPPPPYCCPYPCPYCTLPPPPYCCPYPCPYCTLPPPPYCCPYPCPYCTLPPPPYCCPYPCPYCTLPPPLPTVAPTHVPTVRCSTMTTPATLERRAAPPRDRAACCTASRSGDSPRTLSLAAARQARFQVPVADVLDLFEDEKKDAGVEREFRAVPESRQRTPRLQLRFAIQRAMKPAREVRRVRRVPARARGLQASP